MPDDTPWRDRFAAEQRRHRELLDEISASARRRAHALEDGVADLGTKSAVARELGIDVSVVRRTIREYGAATATSAPSSPTTTE